MIKMAVFDMAGTTVDEDNVVYKTLMSAINAHGFDFTLEEVLAEGAGKEKLQAIRSILASRDIVDETLSAAIFAQFLPMLGAAYQSLDVTEQPHTTEVFHALKQKGIAVALNTGYDRATAESLVKKIGWNLGADFDCLVTASDVPQNRPQPDMIFWAMEKVGITSGDEVFKVGDSVIDIEEGRNAGCRWSIGITTGAQTAGQLAEGNPDFIIHDLSELIPMIENEQAAELVRIS